MDYPYRGEGSSVRDLLGFVMSVEATKVQPSLLDAVALLADRPGDKLARGQVGTVVEALDEIMALVEFSDDDGRAYAIVPCAIAELMVLHYLPQAAE